MDRTFEEYAAFLPFWPVMLDEAEDDNEDVFDEDYQLYVKEMTR